MDDAAGTLEDLARASADPGPVRLVFERLADERRLGSGDPGNSDGTGVSIATLERIAAVAGASRSLARLVAADPDSLDVLAGPSLDGAIAAVSRAEDAAALTRRKRLAYLRIAADDLTGAASLEEVGAALSRLADAVLGRACELEGTGGLAVIAMGKHGAEELNYASDVDVVFVASDGVDTAEATAAARRVLAAVRDAYRVDTALRPEGRNGVLVRSLAAYRAYWSEWARPWEFQALVKSRPCAGDRRVGELFAAAASEAIWSQPFDADAIAELRAMKSRAEELVAKRGLTDRELKRGRGGIRDIEFAVQLLQLVHGRADPALRLRATLPALGELASAGYVDEGDASLLALAYRFLRTVEHRLQLVEEEQVHTVPPPGAARDHLTRVLGLEGSGARTERFDLVLARYQSSVRGVHDRLFFRPLLEVFAPDGPHGRLTVDAAAERLHAFGFHDAERTRLALTELTRGLTRSSRLMQQLLPVLLDWLSEAPDPDLGLLGLRNLTGLPHHRDVLVAAFRESPELARRLCVVLGTSARLGELTRRHPTLALTFGDDHQLIGLGAQELTEQAVISADSDPARAWRALHRIVGSETLRIATGDLVGVIDPDTIGQELSATGDAALTAALHATSPALGFAVFAMGRLGGSELAYGSDLDIVFAYEGSGATDAAEAERVAGTLMRILNGATPAERIWTVDASLRPEGKQGPLARSLDAFAEYHDRWIAAWERQSLIRARPVAGDPGVIETFMSQVRSVVWERPWRPEDFREIRRLKARVERERIPAGEDPQFHLKLGRGSLGDIEWTVQLLQLEHGVPAASTRDAIAALGDRGALDPDESEILASALAYLSRTRNRWHLVGNYVAGAGGPVTRLGSDSLPHSADQLRKLSRSLGERPAEVREQYRRVTRRARRVVERRFYGLEGA